MFHWLLNSPSLSTAVSIAMSYVPWYNPDCMWYPGILWVGFYFFLLGTGSDSLQMSNKLLYSHSTFLISRTEYSLHEENTGDGKDRYSPCTYKNDGLFMSGRSYEGWILGEVWTIFPYDGSETRGNSVRRREHLMVWHEVYVSSILEYHSKG